MRRCKNMLVDDGVVCSARNSAMQRCSAEACLTPDLPTST